MKKELWVSPEFAQLGFEGTEKSHDWQGGVDATYVDGEGYTWESHSGKPAPKK